MENKKGDIVVRKLDRTQLAEYQSGLDGAYRWFQRAYKLLTYEVGRLEDEPGLEALGPETAQRLEAIAKKLYDLGAELKALATGTEEAEASDGETEKEGGSAA